jgi:DNA-binding NtrC family response regulator
MPQDFPDLVGKAFDAGVAPASNARMPAPPHAGVADQEQDKVEGAGAPGGRADRPQLARYGVARLLDERGEMRPIGALEEEVIRFAIGHYRGQMSEVARRLGIGRSTLYRKIKDYGIASGEPIAS